MKKKSREVKNQPPSKFHEPWALADWEESLVFTCSSKEAGVNAQRATRKTFNLLPIDKTLFGPFIATFRMNDKLEHREIRGIRAKSMLPSPMPVNGASPYGVNGLTHGTTQHMIWQNSVCKWNG